MSITAITDARTAPVTEDLSTPETRLEILRGIETMHRVDKPIKSGESFSLGEWAVLNASGELERASASPVPNTYLLFSDGGRFDVAATGQGTLIMNSGIVAKTTVYDDNPSYAVGDALTVKSLGGGESFLTKQSGSEPILGRVISEGNGTLEFESVRS